MTYIKPYMPQIIQTTEGVILRSIQYRDYDQILSLLTPDVGLIKILLKGGYRKQQRGRGLCMPLSRVEVAYREKRSEIFECHEITPLDSFPLLRKELLFLEVGCDLLQAVLGSQLPGKPSPQLYALLLIYLKKIPQTAYPWVLAASFRLKLLMHEGLISFPMRCEACEEVLEKEAYLQEREGWCAKHCPAGSQFWEATELQQMYRLATCQSYRDICSEVIHSSFQKKINILFDACMK